MTREDRPTILHIAVHLGEGVGKAIGGIAIADTEANHRIILLEEPIRYDYIELCRKSGVSTEVCTENGALIEAIRVADVVILNWWNHPLMYEALRALSATDARVILWSHINGLHYPILRGDFVNVFDACMFTTSLTFSLQHWTDEQKGEIAKKGRLVYGMGEFYPEKQPQKTDYALHSPVRVGYVGTLDYAKLHPDYVLLCKAVIDAGIDARFIMAGAIREELERDISDQSLSEHIELCGYRQDVPQMLTDIDVFGYILNPDNYATTENSLLEAMSAGLPIITGASGPEKAIIEDGVTGYTVQTPDEFAERVGELVRDADRRKRLGTTVRKKARERYSMRKNLMRLHEAVEIAKNQKKRRHDFSPVIGDSPCDLFLAGCDNEAREVFGRVLQNGADDGTREAVNRLGAIYRSKIKGSPYQFLRYYPEDMGLRKICSLYDYGE